MAENTSLTLTQARVADVLASGKARTALEVAELADVHRNTVGRLVQNGAVQREVRRQLEEKSDKAREILTLGKRKMAKRLADDNCSDPFLLGAVKVAGDLVSQGVDEDSSELVSPHEMATAYQRRLKDFAAGIKYAQRMQRRAAQ